MSAHPQPVTEADATSPTKEAIAWLNGRINYETAPPAGQAGYRLPRMQQLLALLDDPHLALRPIHIAGTKGKGSVAALTGASLTAAGYRTGVYSSPHLASMRERLAIDGQPCEVARFIELVNEVQPAVAAMDQQAGHDPLGRPTYFEIVTAMAMLHFAKEKVDASVFEVGLGGRLDSTNVCQPGVCVLTTISFDHVKQLGNTLAKIATEKAGIIKPAIPVVSGVKGEEASEIIAAVADQRGCPLALIDRDFGYSFTGGQFNYWQQDADGCREITGLTLALLGNHQIANATVAIRALSALEPLVGEIPESAIRQAMANTTCPARIEVLAKDPMLVVDAAHNAASASALANVLAHDLPQSSQQTPRTLVFASSKDKDLRAILKPLLPQFQRIIFTRFEKNPRATQPIKLEAIAREILAGHRKTATSDLPDMTIAADVDTAMGKIWQARDRGELVCVAGSFFLAAEIRPRLLAALK